MKNKKRISVREWNNNIDTNIELFYKTRETIVTYYFDCKEDKEGHGVYFILSKYKGSFYCEAIIEGLEDIHEIAEIREEVFNKQCKDPFELILVYAGEGTLYKVLPNSVKEKIYGVTLPRKARK